MVLFINENDLSNVSTSLGSSASVWRHSRISGHKPGEIQSVSNGILEFNTQAKLGDSGGAYLLQLYGKDYIIGTQSSQYGYIDSNGNLVPTGNALGNYFSRSEWYAINNFMEGGQSGNVSQSEPENLIVGSNGNDAIHGSYRSDVIMGRGGDDVLNDDDEVGDTVWADDTLIGGEGNDKFFVGAGNDLVFGGDEFGDAGVSDGMDEVDYSAYTSGVVIDLIGSVGSLSISVKDSKGDTDSLYSIEKILATNQTDRLNYSGDIPDSYGSYIPS